MSAHDALQPKQLQMFMTPKEMHSEAEANDFSPTVMTQSPERKPQEPDSTDSAGWGTKNTGGWKTKLDEAHENGTYASIDKHGVQSPVTLWHAKGGVWHHDEAQGGPGRHETTIIGNGHHRVAAATDIARRTGREMYIPVEHNTFR